MLRTSIVLLCLLLPAATQPLAGGPTTLPSALGPTTLPSALGPTTLPSALSPTTLPSALGPTTLPSALGPTTLPSALSPTRFTQAVTYEAFAVRFGILPAFPISGLVAGADRGRTLDIPVMVWLLKGSNGRNVLIDSGFYRQKFLDQWKPRDYRTPAAAVEAAGVTADAVTDVIISHAHWDHVDGADLFPKATIWIQRQEYGYYTGEAWHARTTHGGVDADDMAALLKINTQGRLRFVEGDDQEVLPGIRAYTGGRHTWASQFVSVRIAGGTAVFTSDNVYLYENLEKRAAIAQTLDAASNLKAQDRIRTLASDPRLIVPGHDPAVFERFERVADGVVRIKIQ